MNLSGRWFRVKDEQTDGAKLRVDLDYLWFALRNLPRLLRGAYHSIFAIPRQPAVQPDSESFLLPSFCQSCATSVLFRPWHDHAHFLCLFLIIVPFPSHRYLLIYFPDKFLREPFFGRSRTYCIRVIHTHVRECVRIWWLDRLACKAGTHRWAPSSAH